MWHDVKAILIKWDSLQRIQLSDLAYILTIPFGYHINSEGWYL